MQLSPAVHPLNHLQAYGDMLEVGRVPEHNAAESRSRISAWAIVSSPLTLGFDLTAPSCKCKPGGTNRNHECNERDCSVCSPGNLSDDGIRGANQSWPGMQNMRGWRYVAAEQTLSIHAQGQGQEEEHPEAAASSRSSARLCLDLRGQLAGGLNYQHLLPCDGSGTQHWSLDRKSGQLESNNDTTQCLQGAEWWTRLGRPLVTLGTCHPINGTTGLAPPAQHWSSSPGGRLTKEAFGCVGVSFDHLSARFRGSLAGVRRYS